MRWFEALVPYVKHPERFPDEVIYCDEQFVAILDKFPKAKYHYLIMSRKLKIDSISNLNAREHLFMIENMREVCGKVIQLTKKDSHQGEMHKAKEVKEEEEDEMHQVDKKRFGALSSSFNEDQKTKKSKMMMMEEPRIVTENTSSHDQVDTRIIEKSDRENLVDEFPPTFLYGFHAIPSMQPLHLHMISTDLQSSSMKKRKHWNSFNSEFFVPLDRVIELLRKDGKIQV